MHYSNLVIIEKTDGIEKAVAQAMGPSEETYSGSFWDWYQIGGRWTGTLDGYDPDTDPANLEICDTCHGTGVRRDAVGVANGMPQRGYCNGCEGKGKRVKWPTEWKARGGDVAPIESLTPESYDKFFRIVMPYGRVFGGEDYLPWREKDVFQKREKPPLDWLKKEYADHMVVVVDNHS